MILAGVDEAGLGPRIGPLTTASSAFVVPDDWEPDTPWSAFRDAVADAPGKKETRPAILDSKIAYAAGGMRSLELALGAMTWARDRSFSFDCVFSEGVSHPCYGRTLSPFPCHAEESALRLAGDALCSALVRENAKAAHMQARVLFEPVLNHRYDSGLNKNQALLMETGAHLSRLAECFPEERMLVVVDKQGGRNDYLPFLTGLFPGAWIDSLSVGADDSSYRMRRRGADVVFRFVPKGDRVSFPTALASLAAKYVRERCMAELNAWFCAEVEGLRPTAGYPVDANRWLDEVRAGGRAEELGIGLLVRSR